MKGAKRTVLKLIICISSVLIIVIISKGLKKNDHTVINDFPNSKWMCTSRNVSIVVNDNAQNRGLYKRDGETVYLYISLDSLSEIVEFFVITEEEYHGTLNGIRVSDQKVLGGRFKCDKNSFIVISERDYDADFWENEKDAKFILEFDRVE